MDAAAKQQIVERVRQANNILVTVSRDPTVDQLAACIGLTLLLNRMEKHATAVFSGRVPSTLEFLQPEKTIETNTDSLRDFIISLDKNKADKLRYKVEDQVVKIFITPYKTSIGEVDLTFSQGDFNVEVLLALGISDQAHIDAAISAHGRILHDATVISLMAGQNKSNVGQINWQEQGASSLCEMVVSISEAFGAGLIDNQMATSFLTGIVAETNRFSNSKTTPKVMTISAQLMAAGANQQLIVSKLEPPQVKVSLQKGPAPPASAQAAWNGQPEAKLQDGTLSISHEEKKPDAAPEVSLAPSEIHIDEKGNIRTAADLAQLQEAETAPPEQPADEPQAAGPPPMPEEPSTPPTDQPADTPAAPPEEEKAEEAPMPGPHSLLSPNAMTPPAFESAFTANTQPEWNDPYNSVTIDPLSGDGKSQLFDKKDTSPPKKESAPPNEPPADVDAARSAVQTALGTAPFNPAYSPPVEALNASPVDLNPPANEPPADTDKNDTAPPPFPPPLEPSQGAVIPTGMPPKTS